MNLDASAVDEQLGWHALEPGEVGKDAHPHAMLNPTPEAAIERLLRAMKMFGAIVPTTAALQRMDNAEQHPPIIYPRYPARVLWQELIDPRPFLIGRPERISHLP
jgi:hypothetical protein